jgi:hypothetical protein
MITMTLHKHVMICATLLSVALTALAATTHTIGISLVASPPQIGFNHHGEAHGQDGSIMVQVSHIVNWQCEMRCTSIAIHFDDTPCKEGTNINNSPGKPATCTIIDKVSHPKAYKYKISVDGTDKDPHVIVDNQVIQTPKRKKNR